MYFPESLYFSQRLMKSCLSGWPRHVWLPARLSAELLGSPVSQTAVCPSTEVLRTRFFSVQKPCQPQSNKNLLDQGPLPHAWKWLSGPIACGCLQNGICHHTQPQSFQLPSSDICAGCLAPILLHKLGAKQSRNLGSLFSVQTIQWTAGPGSPDTNRIPSTLTLLCNSQH